MVLAFFLLAGLAQLPGQSLEFGVETVTGRSRTTFKGGLADIVGFSEVEITEEVVDTALANAGIDAPRWLKELFPGIRIDVVGDINRQQSRGVNSVRFFARYKWIGGSFMVSDPRLTPKPEGQKLGNQLKSIRLSLNGDAEALAEHLAEIALADATKPKPFFSKRYDIEGYLHLKKMLMPDYVLLEWGQNRGSSLDFELTPGLRFAADPSPVVDLGSILIISEKLDSLMEGGILRPVENTTDRIAEAIQNAVFGKFKDPRTVPSLGWFARAELLANFGAGFSVVAGAEFSLHKHLSVSGTKPMFSSYAFTGLRWGIQVGRRR